MFCYQCEQTAGQKGCTVAGVCGKSNEVALLQDLLFYTNKGLACYAYELCKKEVFEEKINMAIIQALFTTITNVNFDTERLLQEIKDVTELTVCAHDMCVKLGVDVASLPAPAHFKVAETLVAKLEQAENIGVQSRIKTKGEDATALIELITYSLKGIAAYLDHAHVLGYTNVADYAQIFEILAKLDTELSVDQLVAMALKTGEINIAAMKILDQANTETYGHPEITKVRVTGKAGKAILVSGHDLKDLQLLLEQTKDKGINIYTHGEMLPTNAYPELKKYSHLAGNYGGAWQDQQKEFAVFPGSVLMTTNCIQKPSAKYQDNIFTTGLVAFPGVQHIDEHKDFTPVIERALALPGFAADEEEKYITIGFARNTVLSVAGKVIELVKTGKIKHFFLVGGCDGAKSGRNYYTDFAKQVPDDCVILTLACGKYRFNKLEFGDIEGIPRLLDVGQCNDAYSAVVIASALAEAFETDVNGLPLSIILSWYEQKAVAVLLSLLHLGIKNIRIGPTLPAFVTPAILKVLQDNFNIMPITTAEQDLATILKK